MYQRRGRHHPMRQNVESTRKYTPAVPAAAGGGRQGPYHEVLNPPTQQEVIPGREADMVENRAGGFVFNTGHWARLERFLILGTEGSTYYATQKEMTVENTAALDACLQEDGKRVIEMIIEISQAGRAAKQDPGLFALARAAACKVKVESGHTVAHLALARILVVCRTGSTFLQFVSYLARMRGWGRQMRYYLGKWYLDQPVSECAYQVLKYRSRFGWTHRDVLRKVHINPTEWGNTDHGVLFGYITQGTLPAGAPPNEPPDDPFRRIAQFNALQSAHAELATSMVEMDPSIPREFLTTEQLQERKVWAALTPGMPMTALTRNLATLTRLEVLKPLAENTAAVCQKMTAVDNIRKARLHPLSLLQTLSVYAKGTGHRSSSTWTPVTEIVDALEQAVELSFDLQEPTGKCIYVAVDTSASMGWGTVSGMPTINPRQAAAAIALAIAKTETRYYMRAFYDTLSDLPITKRDSFGSALAATDNLPHGGTDASLPVADAIARGLEVDCFIVITDNETWAGPKHVSQLLQEYRRQSGTQAKMLVLAMTATECSIADPNDPLMLDIVGMDGAAMKLMQNFIAD